MAKKHSKEITEKLKIQDTYHRWRVVNSPALKRDVEFTNLGLKHIEKGTRTIQEKIKRYRLLPYARKIIKESTTYQGTRFQNHHTHYIFEAVIDNRRIRVLVREDRKHLYFYSVFYLEDTRLV